MVYVLRNDLQRPDTVRAVLVIVRGPDAHERSVAGLLADGAGVGAAAVQVARSGDLG